MNSNFYEINVKYFHSRVFFNVFFEMVFKNFIIFLSSSSNDGIEWKKKTKYNGASMVEVPEKNGYRKL